MFPELCQIQIVLVKVLCNKKGLLAPVIPESVASISNWHIYHLSILVCLSLFKTAMS